MTLSTVSYLNNYRVLNIDEQALKKCMWNIVTKHATFAHGNISLPEWRKYIDTITVSYVSKKSFAFYGTGSFNSLFTRSRYEILSIAIQFI
jgi:hypothetical protein